MTSILRQCDLPELEPPAMAGSGKVCPGQIEVIPEICRGRTDGSPMHGKLDILHDFLEYQRAKRRLGDIANDLDWMIKRFLAATIGQNCLRLAFGIHEVPPLGPNWITVDMRGIETKPSSTILGLPDGEIDAVFCTGLERVSQPARLIAEVRRVLKQAGQIWLQVPFNAPYQAADRDKEPEYWRISPEGLRMLMGDFDEIFCSCLPGGSALRTMSFFYGLKPPRVGPSVPLRA